MAKAPSPFISIFSVCLYLCVHIWAHTYIIEKLVTKLEQYLRFMGDLCVIYANIHVYMCLYTHTHTYICICGLGTPKFSAVNISYLNN